MLDGLVVGIVALLAGAQPSRAILLGVAMVALQFGIGATNDVVDAPRDAGHKPGKPIPAGLVSRVLARAIALGSFVLGVALAAAVGLPSVGLAVVVIAIGLAYDVRLKGTAWSWLPFALGIPILPVFGWLGAAGTLPPLFALLVPVAVASGAALAIANSLVDVERDRAAGAGSIASALGHARAWAVDATLVAVTAVAAVLSAWLVRGPLACAVIAGVAAVPLVGVWLSAGGGAGRRERGWEVQAIGLAGLGIAWLIALVNR